MRRYDLENYHPLDLWHMEERENGKYVEWAEVEPLLAGIKAERDALNKDLASEQEGALDLRRRLGARADEPFATFVERLAAERDEARALLIEGDFREGDLRGAQLLMVGSQLANDPKMDHRDRTDPRWTPTLHEAWVAVQSRKENAAQIVSLMHERDEARALLWEIVDAPAVEIELEGLNVRVGYPVFALLSPRAAMTDDLLARLMKAVKKVDE